MDGTICRKFFAYTPQEQKEIADKLGQSVSDILRVLLKVNDNWFVCFNCDEANSFCSFILMNEKESGLLTPKSITSGQFEFTSIRLPNTEVQDISGCAQNHVYMCLFICQI